MINEINFKAVNFLMLNNNNNKVETLNKHKFQCAISNKKMFIIKRLGIYTQLYEFGKQVINVASIF